MRTCYRKGWRSRGAGNTARRYHGIKVARLERGMAARSSLVSIRLLYCLIRHTMRTVHYNSHVSFFFLPFLRLFILNIFPFHLNSSLSTSSSQHLLRNAFTYPSATQSTSLFGYSSIQLLILSLIHASSGGGYISLPQELYYGTRLLHLCSLNI